MPRLMDLQRMLSSPGRFMESRLDSAVGEEMLVIDDRSRRSCGQVVEEKLGRLTSQRSGRFAVEEKSHETY